MSSTHKKQFLLWIWDQNFDLKDLSPAEFRWQLQLLVITEGACSYTTQNSEERKTNYCYFDKRTQAMKCFFPSSCEQPGSDLLLHSMSLQTAGRGESVTSRRSRLQLLVCSSSQTDSSISLFTLHTSNWTTAVNSLSNITFPVTDRRRLVLNSADVKLQLSETFCL